MADSNEEEEDSTQKFDDLNLPPPTSFSLFSIHHSTKPVILFPPTNHENLHISTSPPLPPNSVSDTSSTTSSITSSSSFSPWDDSSSPCSPIKTSSNTAGVPHCNWWEFGLELLTRKVNGSLTFLKNSWIFRYPGVVLVALVYFRWRRRRKNVAVDLREGSDQHLARVIREKDERINELLNQIARMNEVLLSMHKAPSSKTG